VLGAVAADGGQLSGVVVGVVQRSFGAGIIGHLAGGVVGVAELRQDRGVVTPHLARVRGNRTQRSSSAMLVVASELFLHSYPTRKIEEREASQSRAGALPPLMSK